MPAAWRGFWGFLRHPALPDRATGIGPAGFGAVARLFALDLLLMGLLIGSFGVLTLFGVELPEHALEQLEIGPVLIVFILVGAPIGEEILFRGWLSGRPGHVLALAALIGGAVLASVAVAVLSEAAGGLAAPGLLVAAVALAIALPWACRRRPAWAWFQRHFRWFYLGSALAFASIHLFNFGEGATALLLPLTLPQFVLGLILGYLRVRHGLWASMLLHALHNALFIGLVLAAT